MIKSFTLKNFKTHIDSTFNLSDITLIIGSNNSGKSNLLSGISYFSRLIGRANPKVESSKILRYQNYSAIKHKLSKASTPIVFSCNWEHLAKIKYTLEIYLLDGRLVGCREFLDFKYQNTHLNISHGVDEYSSEMLLRTKLDTKRYDSDIKIYTNLFFKDLAFIYYYSFQPALLNNKAFLAQRFDEETVYYKIKNYTKDFEMTGNRPNIAGELGECGENFQELVKYIKLHEQNIYGRFAGYLKRFIKSFNEIIINDGVTGWQFDLGGSNFPVFAPSQISDGLLKAGAIALLCSLESPPSLIMIEEVENGINQKNLKEFLSWLRENSVNGNKIQFVLTSHSPSVIREFSDELDSVYNIYLREKDYKSLVTCLNDALKPLARMGTIEELRTIERNGEEVLIISPSQITELFYNGVLGEL